MWSKHLAATALILVIPAIGQAQVKTDERGAAPANLALGASVPAAVQFVLEASKDTKEGTAAFGWTTGESRFQLAAIGSLTDDATEPLSLKGLPPGAKARLSWNTLHKHGPSAREQLEAKVMCQPILERKTNDAKAALAKDPKSTPPPVICTTNDFDEEHAAVFDELQHLYDPGWLYGVDVEVSRTNFKFLGDGLKNQSENHQAGSLAVRVGRVAPAVATVLGSYEWSHAYKAAGSATTVCSPIADTTSTKCVQGILGKPSDVTRSIASLEVRRFFNQNTAISPSITYDFRNGGSTEVSVPIYFIGTGTSATGGVKFGWRDDDSHKNEITAVVFIGGAIGAIPK